MATFIGFAKKANVEFTHLECSTTGQVKLTDGKYKFVQINVYPKISIADEAARAQATIAVQKTQHYCLISNSINAEVIYHTEIVKDGHRVLPHQTPVVH